MEKSDDVWDIFEGDDGRDDEHVCTVCGNVLEPWEDKKRGGAPVCDYHDYYWDD